MTCHKMRLENENGKRQREKRRYFEEKNMHEVRACNIYRRKNKRSGKDRI